MEPASKPAAVLLLFLLHSCLANDGTRALFSASSYCSVVEVMAVAAGDGSDTGGKGTGSSLSGTNPKDQTP